MMLHVAFTFFYLLLFGVFVALMKFLGREFPASIPPLDFLLLSLATFRITELITCDGITRFLRDPFIERKEVRMPDGDVEEKAAPTGRGFRKFMGELLICPWCAGVWVGTILTYFYLLIPEVARVVLVAFGAVAAGIMFQLFAKWLDHISDKDYEAEEEK